MSYVVSVFSNGACLLVFGEQSVDLVQTDLLGDSHWTPLTNKLMICIPVLIRKDLSDGKGSPVGVLPLFGTII